MHDFTILVLEGAYATGVSATVNLLQAAAQLAPRLGAPAPRWILCSPGGGAVTLQSGLSVATQRLVRPTADDKSVWVVPGIGLDSASAVAPRLARNDARRALVALRAHAAAGGRVAASCSAVFLLHAAGLLAQRRVTTAWWLAPALARLAPECQVDANRMVCADGPVITAGAAFAQVDLMLHLLCQRLGSALADAVSRVLLIDGRQAQAPYIAQQLLANGDALVGRLSARIEAALPALPSVGELAREFGMSERTLSRHVRQATGHSTLALVQSVKLRRARALLASHRLSVEQVAAAVGYQDATALRRLMRKVAGASPSRFRPSA